MHGGGHERGMRSGTLPTHQIVGMGEAYRIAREEMGTEIERIRMLHRKLVDGLSGIEQTFLNGHPTSACRTTSTCRSTMSRASR